MAKSDHAPSIQIHNGIILHQQNINKIRLTQPSMQSQKCPTPRYIIVFVEQSSWFLELNHWAYRFEFVLILLFAQFFQYFDFWFHITADKTEYRSHKLKESVTKQWKILYKHTHTHTHNLSSQVKKSIYCFWFVPFFKVTTKTDLSP